MAEGMALLPGTLLGDCGIGPGGGFDTIPGGVIARPDQGSGHKPPYSAMTPLAFKQAQWDPVLLADLLLAEFLRTDWIAALQGIPGDPPPNDSEIGSLIASSALRADRSDEIMRQANDLRVYWINAVGSASTKPVTWTLIEASLAIGRVVGMYFKNVYKRPRPVHVYPALMPLLLTPRHPSYPNNHALQSRLVARTLGAIAPLVLEPMLALADRIGGNREIAGLHFPSDSVAGAKLADALAPLVQKNKLFADLIASASAEWYDG